MKTGDSFILDRFKDGEKKEYKVHRVCAIHLNVKSVDGKESFAMPWSRVKECEPITATR